MYRARQRLAGSWRNRAIANNEEFFFHQSSCHHRSRTIENSRKRRSRNSHSVCGRLLIQTLEIRQPKRLEFVSSQGLDVELDGRSANRFERAPMSHAADGSDLLRPSHGVSLLRTYVQNERLSMDASCATRRSRRSMIVSSNTASAEHDISNEVGVQSSQIDEFQTPTGALEPTGCEVSSGRFMTIDCSFFMVSM